MTGHDEGDDLVAHLLRRQRAVVVARGQQQVEHVARWLAFRERTAGPFRQHRVDRAVELADRPTQDDVGRRRHGQRHGQGHPRLLDDDVEGVERGRRQPLGVAGEVAAEQRLPHHLQREAHHRLVDVDHGPVDGLPAHDEPVDGVLHVPRHQLERVAVERRLHEPTRGAPGLGVGGEQPVAGDQRERRALQRALAVGAGVGDHPAHGLGVGDEVGRRLRDRQLRDVPVVGPNRPGTRSGRGGSPRSSAASPARRPRAVIGAGRLRATPSSSTAAPQARRWLPTCARSRTSSAKAARTCSVTDGFTWASAAR
ncbi:MAG: hypothetical protein U0S36_13550 [Candidatus Nanopelagicales bacterium]